MIEIIFLKLTTNLIFNAETEIILIRTKQASQPCIIMSSMYQFGIN